MRGIRWRVRGGCGRGALTAQRKHPVILDPDEFDHLPEVAHIPIEHADTERKTATVRLGELAHGGTALLLYSSRERLAAACGDQQAAMALPSRELPKLQRRLGFNAVLLDVSVPPEWSQRSVQSTSEQPGPLRAFDRRTCEPFVYVPSKPFRPGDSEAQLELQPLTTGHRALIAYTSQQALLDGCGPKQYFVRFPSSRLQEAMRQCGADRVLIDTTLPDHLRH
jgi:hypothetical protein